MARIRGIIDSEKSKYSDGDSRRINPQLSFKKLPHSNYPMKPIHLILSLIFIGFTVNRSRKLSTALNFEFLYMNRKPLKNSTNGKICRGGIEFIHYQTDELVKLWVALRPPRKQCFEPYTQMSEEV